MSTCPIRHRLRLEGRFAPDILRDFALRRAALLAVEIESLSVSETAFDSALRSDDEALLGAFEMACLLGPAGCVVTRYESLPSEGR